MQIDAAVEAISPFSIEYQAGVYSLYKLNTVISQYDCFVDANKAKDALESGASLQYSFGIE